METGQTAIGQAATGQAATGQAAKGQAETVTVTCTACQQEIVGLENRRVHYHSDLHVVNLKRKVSGMGPLTEAEFAERVTVLQESKTEGSKKRGGREKSVCHTCHKTFSSARALENHEQSRRHLDMLRRKDASVSDMTEGEEAVAAHPVDGDEEMGEWSFDDTNAEIDAELNKRLLAWKEEGSERRCPFDAHELPSSEEALKYMADTFGFFVPYAERLTNAADLVRYIGQKVCIGFACLACDKGFVSVEDARKHMLGVGHFRVTSNNDAFHDEFGEFYDWGRPAAGDDGWEEVDHTDPEVQTGVLVTTAQGREDSMTEPPIGRLDVADGGDDGTTEIYAIAIGDKLVGHRSYQKYYKQKNGATMDVRDSVVANRHSAQEMQLMALRHNMAGGQSTAVKSAQKNAYHRQQRFELMVGIQNYYVRKTKFKQNMVVMNSGYRA